MAGEQSQQSQIVLRTVPETAKAPIDLVSDDEDFHGQGAKRSRSCGEAHCDEDAPHGEERGPPGRLDPSTEMAAQAGKDHSRSLWGDKGKESREQSPEGES